MCKFKDIPNLWCREEQPERSKSDVEYLVKCKPCIEKQQKEDLKFLKEIKERLSAGITGGDLSQSEYAQQMIDDWIDELENT